MEKNRKQKEIDKATNRIKQQMIDKNPDFFRPKPIREIPTLLEALRYFFHNPEKLILLERLIGSKNSPERTALKFVLVIIILTMIFLFLAK